MLREVYPRTAKTTDTADFSIFMGARNAPTSEAASRPAGRGSCVVRGVLDELTDPWLPRGRRGQARAKPERAGEVADAAFELSAGQVSHVVETDFGFHVILRTE